MTISATVLLVEDDQKLLDGISDLLEVVDLGYELFIMTASNGLEGLEIMDNKTPDLIISDIMMPKMGGFEFLDHLRQNSAWIHIPVIFLSARGTKEDIRAGRVSGAELYITKPFDNEELIEMVKSQLDRTFELKIDRDRRLDHLQRNIIQLLNHEFRTPLTYVTAYYEMLEDGFANQNIEYTQDYLRGIQIGAVRMTRLIDNFVMVIELRTGELFEKYNQLAAPVNDLPDILTAKCREWQSSREGSDRIECHIPPKLPLIYGAATYLQDILDRLIDNALKFSSSKATKDPKIIVSADVVGEEVSISIKDNGIGFPDHVRSQLFDLFFQFNRDQIEQQGSGSGLTVVKGLVEMHNGRIEMDSQVGQGSTFTVYLPIYYPETAETENFQNRRLVAKRSATILLVEDEKFLLHGLRELLEIFEGEYHLRVLTASNGVEGLKILENHKPDLIITDIMMPKMGGYELLANVRQNPTLVHIPVIFLTAKGERQDVIRGRTSGAEEYIVKPYDSEELLELVIKQLDRYFQVQGAIRQDFDELKRGILELLQPDFRNPLMSVFDYTQKLASALEDAQTETEMRDSLKGIQFASRKISRLVEDFIFLAEIRTGESKGSFNYSARLANPSMIALEACDQIRPILEQHGIPINTQLANDLPQIMVDYDKLKSGVKRLIKMMIEHSNLHQDSSILVRSYSENGIVFLALELNGIGLSTEKIKELDQLFSQEVEKSIELSENEPDLVIAKAIIDLHNGQIHIEDDPGKNTRLVISLPVFEPTFEFDRD